MTPEVFAQAILSIEQNYGLRLDDRSVWLRMDDWKRLGRDQMGQKCGRGWQGLRGACKRVPKGGDKDAAIKASKVALADKIRKNKGLRDRNAPKFDPKSLFTKELVDKVTGDYSHSYRSPRTVAEWEKRSFEGFVDDIEALLKSSPIKPESIDKDVEIAAREYMRRRHSVFGANSNSYSSFITGKSKFNAKQASRRSSTVDRVQEGFSAWDKKYRQGIKDRYGLTAAKEEKERIQQANYEKAKGILKERDKKAKAIVAKLPIANKSKGAHAITSADWARTHSDYKWIEESPDGKSRERWMMIPQSAGGGNGKVFLSDKKETLSPSGN